MVENPVLSGSIRMEGMQEFFNIAWTRNLSQILQLSGFKFSIIRITYMLIVLRVANSDKIFQITYTL